MYYSMSELSDGRPLVVKTLVAENASKARAPRPLTVSVRKATTWPAVRCSTADVMAFSVYRSE